MSTRFKKIIVDGYEFTPEMLERWNTLKWYEYEMWPDYELDIETMNLVPVRTFELKKEWPEGDRQPSDYQGEV